MIRKIRYAILVVLLLTLPALSDNKPKMEDVAGKLACYCGTCPHLVVTKCGCGTAEQIKADIKNMIDKGMNEKEIIDSYVAQYGQTVLAAPPGSGFSLTAWILPFAAFIFGGAMLFKFLRRQQRQQPESTSESASATPPPGAPEDESYRERLKRDLEMRQ